MKHTFDAIVIGSGFGGAITACRLTEKGMKVLKPSKALEDGFKKIGEQLTADWLKRAGAEGQAVVEAYRKM